MIEISAFGYIRVSSDEQMKRGFSVEEQMEEINLFAKRENIKIDKFYIDRGFSAGTVKRPDFQKMLTEIGNPNNMIKFVIVRDSSRLIRNLTLKRSIMKVFEKYGVKLICLNRSIDEETPEGELQADFMTLLDENELKKVSPRTIKGLRGSALLGNYPKGGKSGPRGFLKVKNKKAGKGKKLIINIEEKEWILFIFETLATNRMTAADLIKYLKKNKVFNIKWNRDSLYDIVDNPIYYGRLVTKWFDSYDSSISIEYKKYWHDEDHHTVPYISKELFDQVQKAVHHYGRKTKHQYLFSKLVYCVDNEEYLTNEPAWKKLKDGTKLLYRYYGSSVLRKRINENRISEKFEMEYLIKNMSNINQNIYKNLEKSIENKIKRRGYLEDDFDNGYLEEEDFREQIKELNLSILESKKKLNSLADQKEKFSDLSFEKKRAIILSYLKRVNISFENDTIEFVYIDDSCYD